MLVSSVQIICLMVEETLVLLYLFSHHLNMIFCFNPHSFHCCDGEVLSLLSQSAVALFLQLFFHLEQVVITSHGFSFFVHVTKLFHAIPKHSTGFPTLHLLVGLSFLSTPSVFYPAPNWTCFPMCFVHTCSGFVFAIILGISFAFLFYQNLCPSCFTLSLVKHIIQKFS